ncbi:MDR family MFS transporter [Loigolactobacillus binensis]|uniref:MDR family MFS transporter n=1 Tax=Loigolactobacillus binensis TaxID=2559922 RepID=A0ABW3EFB3_9LACO|nr:MDR family MFS transporter [Loigolactobacillus binensis]
MSKLKAESNQRIMLVLVMGTFLAYLNQTLMNVALPSIMRSFSISAAQGQWLSNGYMLVNGIMVPLTAYLIQRFTTRQLYLSAMGVFAFGTIVAGIAPTYFILISGRMIQAAGAGVIAPLMNVSIMNMYAADKRGTAMGWVGLALNFAPALGPTVSGYLVEQYNWRSLFYMIAPLIILDIIFATFMLRNLGATAKLKLNWSGVILSSIGLGSLLLGFSNAGSDPLLSKAVLGFSVFGAIIVALFVYQQVHIKDKLLNFAVFKNHNFIIAVIVNACLMMALYGGMLLLPLYMQNIMHYSAVYSGLAMLPGAVIIAIMSPISGRMYDQWGAKYLSFSGIIVLLIGTLLLSRVTLHSSFTFITTAQAIRQLGLSVVTMPIQTEAFNALPQAIIPDGSAMYTTIRQVAGSFGTALLIGIMSVLEKNNIAHLMGQHSLKVATQLGSLQAIKSTYLIAAIFVLASCLMTLKFKKRQLLN